MNAPPHTNDNNQEDDAHILLFSDTHGRIPLVLKLASLFQQQRKQPIDLILVTGDIGIWPDLRQLDQSTRKYSRLKPQELGFLAWGSLLPDDEHKEMLASPAADFFRESQQRTYQKRAARVLQECLEEVTCPIVFIGGNHEDYAYLQRCRANVDEAHTPLIPVDQTGRLHWLPSGKVFSHKGLMLGGIDGIDAEASGRSALRYPEAIRLDDDKAMDALETLTAQPIDLLLTHDGPPDAVKPGKGSPLMLTILETIQPHYHFFGHYHSNTPPLSYHATYQGFDERDTCGIHINKLSFGKDGRLRPQSMLYLHASHDEANNTNIHTSFLRDPWFQQLRRL